VSSALHHGVPKLSDGEVLASERISGSSSGDLAYIVEMERSRVKVGAPASRCASPFA
jgi:hypothetical protein